MEEDPPLEAQRRRLKLVLPKTFFDQAFLLPHDNSARGFKVSNCYHFIANLVIEVTSCLPENHLMAATTKKAWEDFATRIGGAEFIFGGKALLTLFQNMFVVVPTEEWGSLTEIDSVIALAHRLYETSSLDPILVVDPARMPNFRESAARYYGEDPTPGAPLDLPFKMYDPIEAKAYLQAVFPDQTKDVLRKTEAPWNVF
jgi:hypothetical protein